MGSDVKQLAMSVPMVQSYQDDRKSQTRRVITHLRGFGRVTEFQPSDTPGYDWIFRDPRMLWNDVRHKRLMEVTPYQPGDMLWVREPGRVVAFEEDADCLFEWLRIRYAADGQEVELPTPERFSEEWDGNGRKYPLGAPAWVLNKHGIPYGVFKEAARLFARVTNVRVERVQDISEADAKAEGLIEILWEEGFCYAWKSGDHIGHGSARSCFRDLWDSLNAKRGYGWDVNPWVLAYTIEKTEKPEGWPS